MNRLIGLFVLLLAFQQIAAQETDSLESIVLHDTTSYLTRNIARQHLFIRLAYTDIPRSRAIARQGLAESIRERDTVAMAAFANFLGVSFWIDGESSDSVFIWLRRSAGWARCAGDEKRQMLATFALANEFNKRDMPDSALVRFLEVLPYFERRQDDKSTGATLLNIALLYKIRSHDEKALEYLFRARECGERSGNDQLLGHVFKVLADYQTDDPSRALDYAGCAVTYFRRAGNIFEESAALAAAGWLQYTLAHNARKGIEQLEKARILSEKHNFRTLIADQNGQLAELYLATGNYSRAGKCLDTALEAADTTNVILCRRLEERQLAYYIHTGRAQKALALHNRRMERQIHDSRKELLTALSDAEIRYETDKKEARIEMLSRTRSIYMVLLSACCLVVVLLVSVLILRGRYQRQKRLRMEEHLRQMEREQTLQSARALLRGEMKERSRLSRELHDGLGGLLTMVKLALEKLHKQPEIPREKWTGALELLDKSIVEMRRMSHNLMPEALMRFGLRPVLEEFCAVAPGVHFYFFGDERRFEADIETHFYRIACELINNAIKHSKAHQINVQLLSSTDKISLTVQDDGCGFDTSDVHEGLTTVRSRVSLLGAKLYIFSEKENGTEITVESDVKYEQV